MEAYLKVSLQEKKERKKVSQRERERKKVFSSVEEEICIRGMKETLRSTRRNSSRVIHVMFGTIPGPDII